jgi:hypothetical protein
VTARWFCFGAFFVLELEIDHMTRTFTLPEACRLFQLGYEAVQKWMTWKLVPTAGSGRWNRRELDIRGLLAIGIIKQLRAQKVSVPVIRQLTDYLGSVTPDDLTRAFGVGRTVLVCCGDAAPPALLSPDDTFANRAGREVLMIAVDLEHCYLRLMAAIQKHEREAVANN